MKILAISDLHGSRPAIPACDLLLIGGDICPMYLSHHPDDQLDYLDGPFRRWLDLLRTCGVKDIIGIAGNHDFVFEKKPEAVQDLDLPWVYLQDEATVWDGLVIYGLPWVPNLPSWAFYAKKEELHARFNRVPKGTDIILSHGPPFGYGDLYAFSATHLGCKSAQNAIERVKPKALVCGHIHEGYGCYRFEHQHGVTDIYNVSFVDEHYAPRDMDGIEIVIEAKPTESTEPPQQDCG